MLHYRCQDHIVETMQETQRRPNSRTPACSRLRALLHWRLSIRQRAYLPAQIGREYIVGRRSWIPMPALAVSKTSRPSSGWRCSSGSWTRRIEGFERGRSLERGPLSRSRILLFLLPKLHSLESVRLLVDAVSLP